MGNTIYDLQQNVKFLLEENKKFSECIAMLVQANIRAGILTFDEKTNKITVPDIVKNYTKISEKKVKTV